MFTKKIKKKHFEEKLESVQRTIWDLEFKRFKTQEIREEIRQEYDNLQAKLAILKTRIKKEDKAKNIDEFKRLEDQVVILERDIERYKQQMVGLDLEVQGSKPTNEYPDGVQGINQQLESFRELVIMLKDYIKTI